MNTLQSNSTNIQPTSTIFSHEQNQSDSIRIIAQLILKAINTKQQFQKESA